MTVNKPLILLIVSLFTLSLCNSVSAWECDVHLNAPSAIKVGETKTLSATGGPAGGHFSWSNTPNLNPSGASATLTGFEPDRDVLDYIYVTVTYTTPKGKSCSDTKYIYVCQCDIGINGPDEAKMGQTITLTTEVDDEGNGSYEWESTANVLIEPSDDLSTADFTAMEAGTHTVTVNYTSEDGETCSADHTINVICAAQISGPTSAPFGETIILSAQADPPGGYFEWTPVQGLVDYGETAEFTATEPGDHTLEVTYTDRYDNACTATHQISIGCNTKIIGPNTANLGETITLESQVSPPNSVFEKWSDTDGLVPYGPRADFTGQAPGDYSVEVFYNGPGGEVCTDTHTISVECGITITGPEQALTDEIITLYADSGGDNGTCTWTCSPDADIQGTGETATFTASSPGSYWITATYTNDSGAGCSQDYQVDVHCPCAVEIIGENTLPAGETIDLMADGYPEPDSEFYFWTPVDGLTAGANGTASYEAREPGTATIEVQYYANQECSHDNCFTTRDITAWGMASIHPPCPCINTGTTMASDDFTIVTEPAGFQNQALVTPLTFTTGHPSEDIIVTASTSTGPYADTAETTLTVVNENIKTGMSVDISVPNYIIEPLKTIGLADALDLSITTSFQEFTQCCNFGPGISTDGSFAVSLSVGAGPYTIVGVPIPPKWKDYVAADLLNASLGGSGDVKITGKYAVCDDITTWGGSGDITAEVELASQVTANVPTVIVVNAKVSGSSDITETLGAQGSDLLITTNWGGLTVTGSVKFIVFGDYKKVKFQVNKTYFEKGGLAPVKIPLPSLNE